MECTEYIKYTIIKCNEFLFQIKVIFAFHWSYDILAETVSSVERTVQTDLRYMNVIK